MYIKYNFILTITYKLHHLGCGPNFQYTDQAFLGKWLRPCGSFRAGWPQFPGLLFPPELPKFEDDFGTLGFWNRPGGENRTGLNLVNHAVATQCRDNMPRKNVSQNAEWTKNGVCGCTILLWPHIILSALMNKIVQFRPKKASKYRTVAIRETVASMKYGHYTHTKWKKRHTKLLSQECAMVTGDVLEDFVETSTERFISWAHLKSGADPELFHGGSYSNH